AMPPSSSGSATDDPHVAAPTLRTGSAATLLDERPAFAWGVVSLVALIKLAVHVPALTRYGWFRDEFYYLVCADHLALGYVDQPPLSIALLALWRATFGESP